MDLLENLSEVQMEAVKTIDEDLEIIACAGAGKTGIVTRRIVNILVLKSRIYDYGKAILGHTRGFAHMYVGTIHGFCIKML